MGRGVPHLLHIPEQRSQLGRDGSLRTQPVRALQQRLEPCPPFADRRLLPGEILVELGEHLVEVLARVVGEHVPHLGEPEPQLGESPDACQHDGVPQRVVPIAVAQPLGLRQQALMVVVPDRPRGDADGGGEFSDPHGTSREVDVAAGSRGSRWSALDG